MTTYTIRPATRLIAMLTALAMTQSVWARHEDPNKFFDSWQVKTLYQPAKGSVMIYDHLSDRQVNKAMDDNFGRIENMMFTRIQVSDASETKSSSTRKSTGASDSQDCD
jgi:hypothetical protein